MSKDDARNRYLEKFQRENQVNDVFDEDVENTGTKIVELMKSIMACSNTWTTTMVS